MAKKSPGKNALNVGTLDLNDPQLKTLGRVIEDWNASKSPDAPDWTTETATAELLRKYLDVLQPDYPDEPRKPDYSAAPHA